MVETAADLDNPINHNSAHDQTPHNESATEKGGYDTDQVQQEGTLELTIKKADLTGEQLPQFTQSYISIECQDQKNRTPNAAQKDQHKPVWNATIRIPVTFNTKQKIEKEVDSDQSASESEGVDDDIQFEVFVQEMHDSYISYGQGKLTLTQIWAAAKSSPDGAKGGWLSLDGEAGKILYSAKVTLRELPKMHPEWPVGDERPVPEVVVGSKDQEGDTDMQAEEFKSCPTANQEPEPKINIVRPLQNGTGPIGTMDLEDEDGDSLQNEISGCLQPKEASMQELIDKYQSYVDKSFLNQKKTTEATDQDEEDAQEPNMKFVQAFDTFGSFMKAASFIEDWIRTKKNNPTDFANDFPAILTRGLLIRKILLYLRKEQGGASIKDQNGAVLNPEVRQVHQLIFTKELHSSDDDYSFFFTINLLEACSIRYNVPVLVIRIALNHLGFMIQDGAVTIKPEHQKYAMDKLQSIRSEVIHDYVKHLKLQVSSEYFEGLTRQYLDNQRYVDAATCIMKFSFFDKFDILDLCICLVDINKIQQAKMLVQNVPDLKEKLIRGLSRPQHAKVAAQLVKDYKLNPDEFPELQNLVSITSSNYFIKRAFKSPSHAEYMPLHKIEDLFSGNPRMLLFLVEELLQKGNLTQAQANGNDQVSSRYFQKAAGVWQRHNLAHYNFTSETLQREMARIKYDEELDDMPVDQFGPVSEGPSLQLPQRIEVKFIGNERDVQQLKNLIGKPIVGMDSEWRPTMTKFDSMRPALLQLSDDETAYLVDLVALAASPQLDNILTEIFTHPQSLCIGFSFKSDLDVFARHFPTMKFYKLFTNFIDAQTYYGKVCIASNQSGLAKVTKHLLNQEMCKGEQMSNWERRPLRLSQQHYAALDAFCLIEIIKILAAMAVEKGDPVLLLQNQKHQLNWLETNRSHNYHHNSGGGRHHNKNDNNNNQHGHGGYNNGGGQGYHNRGDHNRGGYGRDNQGGGRGGYNNGGGDRNQDDNNRRNNNRNKRNRRPNNNNQGNQWNSNQNNNRGQQQPTNNNSTHHNSRYQQQQYQPVGGHSNSGPGNSSGYGGNGGYQNHNSNRGYNNHGNSQQSAAAQQHNPFANYSHQNQQPFQPNAQRFQFS